MYKRRKNTYSEAFNTLFFMVVFSAIILFFKTKSINKAIIFFIILMVIVSMCASLPKILKHKKLISSGIYEVDKMSGEDFEQFLLVHFKNLGYKANTTPKTNDYGADLVLQKDGLKIVVQAKRWTSKVGIEAIQQIVAALNYYNASKGLVITNNYFTKNAYELASKNNIELWNRNKLIEIMNKSNGKDLVNNISKNLFDENIPIHEKEQICPRCGSKLVIRSSKNGLFWGCSNFPKCRYTRNV